MTDERDLNAGLLARGKQTFAAQPFSALLGAELVHRSNAGAEIRIPVRTELRQNNGFVHGGVISYAADNALAFAGGGALGQAAVTSEFKINFVRPATGELISAKAVVVHAGKNQAVCRCDVYMHKEGQESLCAVAQGTIVKLGRQPDVITEIPRDRDPDGATRS